MTDTIKIKGCVVEDFVNYKHPSMYIGIGGCDFKCCKEANIDISICQNSTLAQQKELDISLKMLYNTYINNDITKAIVVGGLEPMTRFDDVIELIGYFRANNCQDTFVIYTGYYPYEIKDKLAKISIYPNIIVKFGRFIPNHNPHYDEVLGVNLISDNQYAEVIS